MKCTSFSIEKHCLESFDVPHTDWPTEFQLILIEQRTTLIVYNGEETQHKHVTKSKCYYRVFKVLIFFFYLVVADIISENVPIYESSI